MGVLEILSPEPSLRTGRPQQFQLTLSATERTALLTMAHSRTLPYSHVRRAQIVLRSAAGEQATTIAAEFGITVQSVCHWRKHFHAHGLAGLSDAPRSGRPRTHDDDRVAALLRTVLTSKLKGAANWCGGLLPSSRSTTRTRVRSPGPRPRTRSSQTVHLALELSVALGDNDRREYRVAIPANAGAAWPKCVTFGRVELRPERDRPHRAHAAEGA